MSASGRSLHLPRRSKIPVSGNSRHGGRPWAEFGQPHTIPRITVRIVICSGPQPPLPSSLWFRAPQAAEILPPNVILSRPPAPPDFKSGRSIRAKSMMHHASGWRHRPHDPHPRLGRAPDAGEVGCSVCPFVWHRSITASGVGITPARAGPSRPLASALIRTRLCSSAPLARCKAAFERPAFSHGPRVPTKPRCAATTNEERTYHEQETRPDRLQHP